eukprot:TRINITY_DN22743_c0_g1_i6.p6 TRINITY_DN22743_c0_g1~~TRINITY_DN22743_c0_g1_i6.p6  ORF type:complete len:125 (-),score=4.97 TRINITY_DN22743_c0_g1_i6:1032-1406(-)
MNGKGTKVQGLPFFKGPIFYVCRNDYSLYVSQFKKRVRTTVFPGTLRPTIATAILQIFPISAVQYFEINVQWLLCYASHYNFKVHVVHVQGFSKGFFLVPFFNLFQLSKKTVEGQTKKKTLQTL